MEGGIEKSARSLQQALSKADIEVAEMPILDHRLLDEPRLDLFEGISANGAKFLNSAAGGAGIT